MEHSSPVSKVVATATPTAWAQAYSAGKLHLVVNLEGESEESIASLGKDILERLQREFFALDEKNLSDLKKVIETVISEVKHTVTLSLVLTTIVEDVLYIVIYNSGSVLLKREGKIVVVGNGDAGKVSGFSGNLNPNDLVLVATEGLLKTVSSENIEKSLSAGTPHEVSESLAPFLHSSESGTEAGLVWSMIGSRKPLETTEEDTAHPNDTLELDDNPQEEKAQESSRMPAIKDLANKISIPSINLMSISRKQLITIAVIALVLILGGSILFESSHREDKKQSQEVQKIIDANKQKYDDAVSLMSLNKTLAIEELQDVKTNVESKKSQFPEGSNAAKTLDAFLSQVESALGGNVQTKSKITMLFDASKNSDIPTVSFITAKGGEIVVIGSKKGGLLNSDGTVASTFNGADNIEGLTADEKNVYVLTDGTVSKITKDKGAATTIIQKQPGPISIDTFAGNIYLLSSADKTVYKYVPTAFAKASYFASDTTLASPSSLTIDASIYVVSNGKILKFTRGAADNFSYTGGKLSPGSQIYTDIDYLNLYVLDPSNQKIIILDKSGNLVSNVNLKGMKNITSIAADEKIKKIYVVSDNKIYSIDY